MLDEPLVAINSDGTPIKKKHSWVYSLLNPRSRQRQAVVYRICIATLIVVNAVVFSLETVNITLLLDIFAATFRTNFYSVPRWRAFVTGERTSVGGQKAGTPLLFVRLSRQLSSLSNLFCISLWLLRKPTTMTPSKAEWSTCWRLGASSILLLSLHFLLNLWQKMTCRISLRWECFESLD